MGSQDPLIVKYFIDCLKATGPYDHNNINNYNKLSNTTLYQNNDMIW